LADQRDSTRLLITGVLGCEEPKGELFRLVVPPELEAHQGERVVREVIAPADVGDERLAHHRDGQRVLTEPQRAWRERVPRGKSTRRILFVSDAAFLIQAKRATRTDIRALKITAGDEPVHRQPAHDLRG